MNENQAKNMVYERMLDLQRSIVLVKETIQIAEERDDFITKSRSETKLKELVSLLELNEALYYETGVLQ